MLDYVENGCIMGYIIWEGCSCNMRNLSKRWKIAILIIVLYIFAVGAVTALVDGRHVKFILRGDQTMTVELGGEFHDPGRSAVTVGRLFGDGRELDVETYGSVDAGTPGVYELAYSVKFLGEKYSTTRTVIVADREAPVIELKYVEGYAPNWFTGYEEEGYSAYDNCDGDITNNVVRVESDGLVTYTVTDRSGNSTTAERHIPAAEAPRIVLNGETDMAVNASLWFRDPGFTVSDSLGNDLSDYVTVEGKVSPYTPGTYELCYSIENGLGERVETVRRVTVKSLRNSDSVAPDGKTIYLTFDDGPGPYTDELLDILGKYNVKATFFVTAEREKYRDCIGRAYREGHSIGVHTCSHDYYEIYASEEAYFDDFFAMEDIIYEQTGEYTKLFRFPGGSSNTVSSFNPGIMSRLTKAMENMGYKYFDWNVTSGDAGETTKTDVVLENVIDGCTGRKTCVVLQHDIKDYSVDAVEQIIIWGLNNGYSFRGLDMDSPDAHHGVNN